MAVTSCNDSAIHVPAGEKRLLLLLMCTVPSFITGFLWSGAKRKGSRHASAATHTCSQSQASWNGAKVAVKLIRCDSDEKLQDSVTEAITGRMLAHPHVVISYMTAVLSAQEVLAALDPLAWHHLGDAAALHRSAAAWGSQPMLLADKAERLIELGGTDSSQHSPSHGDASQLERAGTGGRGSRGLSLPGSPPHPWEGVREGVPADPAVGHAAGVASCGGAAAGPSTGAKASTSAPLTRLADTYDDFIFANAHVDGQEVVSLEEVAKSMKLGPGQHLTAVVVGHAGFRVQGLRKHTAVTGITDPA